MARSESSTWVYAGAGASHSWTWLADLFERNGIFDVEFVTEKHILNEAAGHPSRVIISGGDGFEIASALSGDGFTRLRDFIETGGHYVGICAGAYLPLPSSLEPFRQFNISSTRILNIRPGTELADGSTTRHAVRYGSCSIFHPVRGGVLLDLGGSDLNAPLYGGPIFMEPEDDEVIMRYLGFDDHSAANMHPDEATALLDHTPAAIRCRHGEGILTLLGPHLEHPDYAEANQAMLDILGMESARRYMPGSHGHGSSQMLDRSIADLKVAILGLEHKTFVIGSKLWDGSRLMELLTAVERRRSSLQDTAADDVLSLLDAVRSEIIDASSRDAREVESAPGNLVEAARLTVNEHFSSRR